jgi:hypothetical protein
MSQNMKIFQIYYKPELAQHCDPAFTPLDNTSNPRPELREWGVWDREHKRRLSENLDLWGYVSWKFKEKTNLTGQQVLDHIVANPGYDVYLFNPCILNEAVFINGWEQGDLYHPNISAIGDTFLSKLGYEDYKVKEVLLDRTRMIFANYLVGSRRFWDMFMEFSNQLFTAAEADLEFKHQVFGQGLSNYAHDKSLPNFTFLIERLIPTFLELNDFSVCPYTYTHDTVYEKYQPHINDILALSNLKVAVNQYESDELYTIWNHYRLRFLAENPGILNLE